ncbi:lactoylglutathione lyase [Marinilactibacillus sp. 15R]|uniref:Aldoketomutase n=1 Tax=Marinilactibacillus piezotolerans TaxID=258723 RepID=A0A1I4B8B9_9LACT|nr:MULTISPECIES: VOC family protein [Marinilactibacillus]API88861.1 lactoylglutathione lyase [Marinilactibacillus sp. 15R]SFK64156.1 lactoylglutathione lyase [Marinilactibacillus piezotolerans]
MPKKALHTCVRVKDLEKSVKFYKDVLGMEITRKADYPDGKFTLVYLALPGDDYEVELTYNYDQEEPYEIGNGYGHIAISVDDLKATHEEYSKTGYEVTDLKGLSDGAANYFFIKDPDGYKIEVIQAK